MLESGPELGNIGLSGGDLKLDGVDPRSGMSIDGRTGATPYSFIVGRRTPRTFGLP
jgi:hypothetical protein